MSHNAEIIAVGSEMLTSQRLDTNSLYIADQLNGLGVEVCRKLVIGDDCALVAEAVQDAMRHADIVILSGGLGPTEDDLTREAVARALGRPLQMRHDLVEAIEERFRRRQRKMAENNKRQAYVIEGGEVLPNPNGTAVGQWIEENGHVVILLPGPPGELKPMFTRECMPRLAQRLPAQVIRTRLYRVTGMTESDLDHLIAPVYSKFTNPATTILASPFDIHVHLRARCSTEQEAERLLAEVGDPVVELLGDRIFSRNGDSLEAVTGAELRKAGATVAVAESCTGGMLAERITAVPASSDYFVGGFLVYNNSMKESLLGIDHALIERHTAVSPEAAQAMAEQARARAGATYGVSTTGEAGPESSTGVPVGIVYIGFAGPGGSEVRKLNLPGDRTRIRMFATQAALDLLRRNIGK
ncbi:MAG: competence/damage-inducible protein A [Bryobacterales bacterium]|nr:competence/damage-inducible protein A [Bryobacterales bacterium]MBV9399862.1 competence/damage-inducible protein A [Bryobacterales bacterium]